MKIRDENFFHYTESLSEIGIMHQHYKVDNSSLSNQEYLPPIDSKGLQYIY